MALFHMLVGMAFVLGATMRIIYTIRDDNKFVSSCMYKVLLSVSDYMQSTQFQNRSVYDTDSCILRLPIFFLNQKLLVNYNYVSTMSMTFWSCPFLRSLTSRSHIRSLSMPCPYRVKKLFHIDHHSSSVCSIPIPVTLTSY